MLKYVHDELVTITTYSQLLIEEQILGSYSLAKDNKCRSFNVFTDRRARYQQLLTAMPKAMPKALVVLQ